MRIPQIDPELAGTCRTAYVRLVGLLALDTGDLATAEVLAWDALIRLHRRWPSARSARSVPAWLAVTALELSGSRWRRRVAAWRTGRDGRAAPHEPAEVTEVRAAVAALPRPERVALLLRYYAGLSVEETAAALRCSSAEVTRLNQTAVNALHHTVDEVEDMIELARVPDG